MGWLHLNTEGWLYKTPLLLRMVWRELPRSGGMALPQLLGCSTALCLNGGHGYTSIHLSKFHPKAELLSFIAHGFTRVNLKLSSFPGALYFLGGASPPIPVIFSFLAVIFVFSFWCCLFLLSYLVF